MGTKAPEKSPVTSILGAAALALALLLGILILLCLPYFGENPEAQSVPTAHCAAHAASHRASNRGAHGAAGGAESLRQTGFPV